MRLADLDIEGVHRMGYAPVSKVLSTYTSTEELALDLPLALAGVERHAQLVIHRPDPQLRRHRRHRHRHHVSHERMVVLDMPLIAQNRVGPCEVSPKTVAKYKINKN